METDVESWARKKIAEAGGLMLKWVSPGIRGVPDDIVFWPGNVVHFIEFKTDERVAPDQYRQNFMHQRLEHYGWRVLRIDNRSLVAEYIERVRTR